MGRVTGGRRRLPIENVVSAGGVVWRKQEGHIEVIVCGRDDGLRVLPKGTPDPGEDIEQTALREVQEETGLEVRLGEPLGAIEYWFTRGSIRYHKNVYHWLMEPVGGDVAKHDHEFDTVEWMEIGVAMRRLSYENERKVLARAAEKLGVAV